MRYLMLIYMLEPIRRISAFLDIHTPYKFSCKPTFVVNLILGLCYLTLAIRLRAYACWILVIFHVVGQGDEEFDFSNDNSYYKIMNATLTYAEAVTTCQSSLNGDGRLLNLMSTEEISQIETELIIRHEGAELEYWVDVSTSSETILNLTMELLPEGNPPQKIHCTTLQF